MDTMINIQIGSLIGILLSIIALGMLIGFLLIDSIARKGIRMRDKYIAYCEAAINTRDTLAVLQNERIDMLNRIISSQRQILEARPRPIKINKRSRQVPVKIYKRIQVASQPSVEL